MTVQESVLTRRTEWSLYPVPGAWPSFFRKLTGFKPWIICNGNGRCFAFLKEEIGEILAEAFLTTASGSFCSCPLWYLSNRQYQIPGHDRTCLLSLYHCRRFLTAQLLFLHQVRMIQPVVIPFNMVQLSNSLPSWCNYAQYNLFLFRELVMGYRNSCYITGIPGLFVNINYLLHSGMFFLSGSKIYRQPGHKFWIITVFLTPITPSAGPVIPLSVI